MRERFLVLLMCVQVLVCPALCVAKCSHTIASASIVACSTEASSGCGCCSHDAPKDQPPIDSDQPQTPCDSSDCPDCFCTGSLVVAKESVAQIDFAQVGLYEVFQGCCDLVGLQADATSRAFDISRPLYGRALLRTYCVLLI